MRLEIGSRRFYLGRDYSEAIAAAGGALLHLGLIPDPSYISSVLSGLDGILLPGSDSDVDPAYYGQEPHRNLKNVVPEKDQTDRLVIQEAEKLGLPIFAICYGMQALNVARGGTLIQDINSTVEGAIKHEQGIPLERGSHKLKFEKNSVPATLASELGLDGDIRVNSHHHQAIDLVGDNLRAVGWASDGIIECVEDDRSDRLIIGVQWHPELSWANDAFSRGLFEKFVGSCKKLGVARSSSATISQHY